MKNSIILFLIILAILLNNGNIHANTYTVLNVSNSGVGSLRDAINLANANPGADLIVFNIAPGGPQSITISSALFISGSLTIDGSTQPGWSSTPIIKVGENLANDAVFWVNTGIAIFKHLDVSKTGAASGKGFYAISSSGCTIQNCWVRNRDDGIVVRFAGTNPVTVIGNDFTDSGVNGGSATEFAHMNGNIVSHSNTYGGATLKGILLDVVSNITISAASGNIQVGSALKEISVPVAIQSGTNITVSDLDLAKTGTQGNFGIYVFGTNGLTINNCIFKNRYPGFSVRISKNLNISCNLIEKNKLGIEFDGLTAGTQNIIDNNFICNNIAVGQYGSQLVTAQNNFWNTASAPPQNGFNGYSGKVDATNWILLPAPCAPSYVPTCSAIYFDPSTYVSLTCPANTTVSACQSQSSINTAFAQWLATATFSGGCNAVLSNNNTGAPSSCGGSKKVSFTVTSLCEPPKTCTASFTVLSSPLTLVCADDVIEAACQPQAVIDSKYNNWLASCFILGGCHSNLSYTNSGPPSACGGSTMVTWTATSSCEGPQTCSASFSVTNVSNVILTCPSHVIEASCQDQASIDSKFAIWLGTASFNGGCNASLSSSYSGFPSVCGSSTLVTFTVVSSCESPVTCTAVFTVDAPAPVTLNCPSNQTVALCQTQAAIDNLYAAWLSSASFTGGCNATLSNDGGAAPSHYGGSKTVSWTVTSSCGIPVSCSRIFSVTGPDSDCDGLGDACDVCPGGDDKVDNNGDGLPDCKYPPVYSDIISSWKCTNNKVYLCHTNNQGMQSTLCLNYNALANHINHGDYIGPCGNAACGGNQLKQSTADNYLGKEENLDEDLFFGILRKGMLVYPNPAKDEIIVLIPGHPKVAFRCNILDLTGRIVQVYDANGEEENYKIEINKLPRGMYMLEAMILDEHLAPKIFIKD